MGNAKGALRYHARTETGQCTQRGEQYTAKEARGAAARVASHTGTNRKKRHQKEQHSLENSADVNADATRLLTLLRYGRGKRGIPKRTEPDRQEPTQKQPTPDSSPGAPQDKQDATEPGQP